MSELSLYFLRFLWKERGVDLLHCYSPVKLQCFPHPFSAVINRRMGLWTTPGQHAPEGNIHGCISFSGQGAGCSPKRRGRAASWLEQGLLQAWMELQAAALPITGADMFCSGLTRKPKYSQLSRETAFELTLHRTTAQSELRILGYAFWTPRKKGSAW